MMNEILEKIPDKQLEHKDTTSKLWKKDLYDFFKNKKTNNILEIGTNNGWTTFWCSHFFDHVYTIENSTERIQSSKNLCIDRKNITFILGDAYKNSTYANIPLNIDAIIIDCIHTYNAVIDDINRALTYYNNKKIYIIFDDYGHPESTGVHKAINEAIKMGLKVEKYIGQPAGYIVHRNNNTQFQLIHQEGIILSYGE